MTAVYRSSVPVSYVRGTVCASCVLRLKGWSWTKRDETTHYALTMPQQVIDTDVNHSLYTPTQCWEEE